MDDKHPGLPPHLIPPAMWFMACMCWLAGAMLSNLPMYVAGGVILYASTEVMKRG